MRDHPLFRGGVSQIAFGFCKAQLANAFEGDDDDGDLDLTVTNYRSNHLAVWMGDGHGGFTGPTLFALPAQPDSVTTIDLNGDGPLDLFMTC